MWLNWSHWLIIMMQHLSKIDWEKFYICWLHAFLVKCPYNKKSTNTTDSICLYSSKTKIVGIHKYCRLFTYSWYRVRSWVRCMVSTKVTHTPTFRCVVYPDTFKQLSCVQVIEFSWPIPFAIFPGTFIAIFIGCITEACIL